MLHRRDRSGGEHLTREHWRSSFSSIFLGRLLRGDHRRAHRRRQQRRLRARRQDVGSRAPDGAHAEGNRSRQIPRGLHDHRALHRRPRAGWCAVVSLRRGDGDGGGSRVLVSLHGRRSRRCLWARRELAHGQLARGNRSHPHARDLHRANALFDLRVRLLVRHAQSLERSARSVSDLASPRLLARQLRCRIFRVAHRPSDFADHRSGLVSLRGHDLQPNRRGGRSLERAEALVLGLDSPRSDGVCGPELDRRGRRRPEWLGDRRSLGLRHLRNLLRASVRVRAGRSLPSRARTLGANRCGRAEAFLWPRTDEVIDPRRGARISRDDCHSRHRRRLPRSARHDRFQRDAPRADLRLHGVRLALLRLRHRSHSLVPRAK